MPAQKYECPEDHEEFHARAKGQTDRSLLCRFHRDKTLWVPQSLIHDDSEVWEEGQVGRLVLPVWWATKKGLI